MAKEKRIIQEIAEALHDFVGNDFDFKQNDDNTLAVTEYNEYGDPIGRYKVTLSAKVERLG